MDIEESGYEELTINYIQIFLLHKGLVPLTSGCSRANCFHIAFYVKVICRKFRSVPNTLPGISWVISPLFLGIFICCNDINAICG